LSQDAIGGLKFVKEKKLLAGFFNEISIDSGKFCYGVSEVMRIFETGVIETIIIWENLE
jgi:peptide chain release factor subunit 1